MVKITKLWISNEGTRLYLNFLFDKPVDDPTEPGKNIVGGRTLINLTTNLNGFNPFIDAYKINQLNVKTLLQNENVVFTKTDEDLPLVDPAH